MELDRIFPCAHEYTQKERKQDENIFLLVCHVFLTRRMLVETCNFARIFSRFTILQKLAS